MTVPREQFNEIIEDLGNINALIELIKDPFHEMITDQTVPLEERWEAFKQGSVLSRHTPYEYVFDVFYGEDGLGDWCYVYDTKYGYGEKVDTVEMVEYFIQHARETVVEDWLTPTDILMFSDPKKIELLKEQILESGIRTFVCDVTI